MKSHEERCEDDGQSQIPSVRRYCCCTVLFKSGQGKTRQHSHSIVNKPVAPCGNVLSIIGAWDCRTGKPRQPQVPESSLRSPAAGSSLPVATIANNLYCSLDDVAGGR